MKAPTKMIILFLIFGVFPILLITGATVWFIKKRRVSNNKDRNNNQKLLTYMPDIELLEFTDNDQ